MTLAEFLSARLDEDEAIAKAALAGPWHVNRAPFQQGPGLQIVDEAGLVVTWTPGFYKRGDSDAAHIARHDPDRVLRDVEAGRRLIADYLAVAEDAPPDRHLPTGELEPAWAQAGCLRRELARRTAVHDQHPDYEPAWRPE